MAKDIIAKSYKNIANPFERAYAESVVLANDIVVATTKLNGFIETAFCQSGGTNPDILH